MKGKKFNAAEKHFKEKEEKFKKEVKNLSDALLQQSQINTELFRENHRLVEELNQLKKEYAKLLEYSGLSINDIQTALKAEAAIVSFAGILKTMNRY